MTDLQITLAVGGALGVIFGACGALVLVWLFRPRLFNAATHAALHTHPSRGLAPRARAPRLRATHPARQRPHRTADPTATIGMGMLDTTRGTH